MSQLIHHQPGIVSEPSLHGLTLLLRITADDAEQLRSTLNRYPELAERLEERFSDAMLSCVLAIGDDFWRVFSPDSYPDKLTAARFNSNDEHQAPIKHFDIALIVRSDRVDANHFAGRVLLDWLAPIAELESEIPAFRYLDGRNIFGFHSTPKIPHGLKRRQMALTENGDFTGGSYLWMQFSRLDVRRWEQLESTTQESLVGQDKLTGKPSEQHSESHYALTQMADDKAFWRLHMPVADMRVQGEIAWYWSNDPEKIRQWLSFRHGVNEESISDPLLDYSESVFIASFFAPSLNYFRQL